MNGNTNHLFEAFRCTIIVLNLRKKQISGKLDNKIISEIWQFEHSRQINKITYNKIRSYSSLFADFANSFIDQPLARSKYGMSPNPCLSVLSERIYEHIPWCQDVPRPPFTMTSTWSSGEVCDTGSKLELVFLLSLSSLYTLPGWRLVHLDS